MKIGIITELSDNVINYGNCLQAYALNYYVRSVMKNARVETIKVKHSLSNSFWTKRMVIPVIVDKGWCRIKKKIWRMKGRGIRRKTFIDFSIENIPQCKDTLKYEDFTNLDYDIYVVGSDVVWLQFMSYINRIKFLDLPVKKTFKRISYAASFARDWIPEENKNAIYNCLRKFENISVREKSSVELLHSIGIEKCTYALDPTLLLRKEEWEKMEVRPVEVNNEKYAFIYLLGEDIEQYREAERLCHEEGIKTVVIPYASGERDKCGHLTGDIQIWECSPQNWLWLVHHAEYVVTDSFHGLAFSTIFKRRFIAVERKKSNLGNRITDFLCTIGQENKYVQIDRLASWDDLDWDYEEIDRRIETERRHSVEYLKKSLGMETENESCIM